MYKTSFVDVYCFLSFLSSGYDYIGSSCISCRTVEIFTTYLKHTSSIINFKLLVCYLKVFLLFIYFNLKCTFSLMNESPRWLIANKRYDRAYRILFKQKSHYEIIKTAIESPITTDKKIVSNQTIITSNSNTL